MRANAVPFGALDAMTRERLQQEWPMIWRTTGLSVIFVTHPPEAASILRTASS